MPAPPKVVKDHDGDVEECDKDFIKHTVERKKSLKALVRKVYFERKIFSWGVEQDKAFSSIKDTI